GELELVRRGIAGVARVDAAGVQPGHAVDVDADGSCRVVDDHLEPRVMPRVDRDGLRRRSRYRGRARSLGEDLPRGVDREGHVRRVVVTDAVDELDRHDYLPLGTYFAQTFAAASRPPFSLSGSAASMSLLSVRAARMAFA